MAQRILIVEDDANIARLLAEQLGFEGFETAHSASAAAALRALEESFDLVVLDLGLPDGNGFAVCREIRARSSSVPILVLTARHQTVDKVRALDWGADDYLTKPFDLQELLARVRALLRRSGAPAPGAAPLRLGNLELHPARRRVSVGGSEVHLTGREFGLLELLLSRAGEVVSRDEFLERLWPGVYVTPRSIDVHVGAVRRKLAAADAAAPEIESVRGVGYRLAGTPS